MLDELVGSNNYGQLGYGSTYTYEEGGMSLFPNVFSMPDIPLGLQSGVSVVSIACGGFTTCAILSNGEVKCWG